MKKIILIISIFAVLVLAGFLAFNNFFPKVNIPQTAAGLKYVYADKNVNVNLNAEESETLRNILNGKRKFIDDPSCGLNKDISIKFGNLIFCVARDSDAIVKLGDRYINISETDREKINHIFKKYGGSFPCE